MSREILDFKGLNCPLPVLRVNKRIKDIAKGAELEVYVTDPAAPRDFRQYCSSTGHEFLSCDETDNVFSIIIRKNL
ncbi:MAG: sulfurtransferase tusA [Magnetovibrio sp.]|nr:sulfurtransferase tusA [Magnetovibrio sp.]